MKSLQTDIFREPIMGDDDRQIKYIKVSSAFSMSAIPIPGSKIHLHEMPLVGGDGLHPDGDQQDPRKPRGRGEGRAAGPDEEVRKWDMTQQFLKKSIHMLDADLTG